jgi:hypothetical protein
MIDYVRTDEQTWSKHGPESAADEGKGMVKIPVQGGCAARDWNPEPADEDSVALPIELAALETQ